jgi:hypothetical protein
MSLFTDLSIELDSGIIGLLNKNGTGKFYKIE